MNRRLGLLGGLLAAQIALAVFLLWRTPADGPGDGVLMDVTADAVAGLRIEDGDGDAVTLDRDGDGWRLADAALPADAGKVEEVIGKLVDLRASWPVATTAGAAERFEVTSASHQRRIELTGNDGELLAVLFLGTSPGYGRVHGRLDGSDDVYALNLSNYEVPAALDDWLDQSLLAADGDIAWVVGAAGWRLEGGGDGWLVDGVAADQDAVAPVVERLAELRVLGVFEAAGTDLEDRGTVRYQDGTGEHVLDFAFDGDEDRYVVTSSRHSGRFTVASYIAEQILIDAAGLRVLDTEPLPAEQEGTEDGD